MLASAEIKRWVKKKENGRFSLSALREEKKLFQIQKNWREIAKEISFFC